MDADKLSKLKQLGMPYDTALEHQKKCQFKKQPCPMNCGQKIFLHEIDKHQKLCLNYEEKCEKCEMTYMPNRVKSAAVTVDSENN